MDDPRGERRRQIVFASGKITVTLEEKVPKEKDLGVETDWESWYIPSRRLGGWGAEAALSLWNR